MISKCISLSTNILRIYQINYWNLLTEREVHKLVGANCLYILQIYVQIFLTLKRKPAKVNEETAFIFANHENPITISANYSTIMTFQE